LLDSVPPMQACACGFKLSINSASHLLTHIQ
jgi:hypothetical protein